jgi:hypothetical protein
MKARRGRKNADDALVLALACGATIENAASKAGVCPRTAHRRLKDPEFVKRLDDLRADMLERATAMLTAAAMEAVKTLVSLQATTIAPAVRLGAARTILEMGAKYREAADLAQRIATLEKEWQNRTVA